MSAGDAADGNASTDQAPKRKLLLEAQLSISLPGGEEHEPPSPPTEMASPTSSPIRLTRKSSTSTKAAASQTSNASTLTVIVLWYASNIGTLLLNKLLMRYGVPHTRACGPRAVRGGC